MLGPWHRSLIFPTQINSSFGSKCAGRRYTYQKQELDVQRMMYRACALPRIPLIEDLTTSAVPPGLNVIAEYEPASQWFIASVTMAAGWLKQNGGVSYNAMAQSPAKIREALSRLGIDCARLEAGPEDYERLRIWDFYTSTLGLKSNEKLQAPSLKVAEISILYVKQQFKKASEPDRLTMVDDWSSYSRFNEEKSWVEFLLTRIFLFVL